MTYWAREHERNLRRIGDMTRELEYHREEIIPELIEDLLRHGNLTHDSRAALEDAQKDVTQALRALNRAFASLPTPQFQPYVRHQTADEVMERDA